MDAHPNTTTRLSSSQQRPSLVSQLTGKEPGCDQCWQICPHANRGIFLVRTHAPSPHWLHDLLITDTTAWSRALSSNACPKFDWFLLLSFVPMWFFSCVWSSGISTLTWISSLLSDISSSLLFEQHEPMENECPWYGGAFRPRRRFED